MLHGENNKPGVITDYREYHTDTTVRFVVKMTAEQFRIAHQTGIHKYFRLQKNLSLNSMVMFDSNGCLRRYDNVNEILHEFFTVRTDIYAKRKAYMEGMLGAESCKLNNIARFIMEKIEGKIKVENLKKADICKMLKSRNYDPDPVVKWKKMIERDMAYEGDDLHAPVDGADEEDGVDSEDKKDYDYLLGMPIWNLTMEKKEKILKEQKEKGDELKALQTKTPTRLWLDDLDEFLGELNRIEGKEKEDESVSQLKAFKAGLASKDNGKKKPVFSKTTKLEYLPAEDGELVEPVVDAATLKEAEKNKEAARVKRENQDPNSVQVKKEFNIVDLITLDNEEVRAMNSTEINDAAIRLLKPTGPKPKKSSPAKKTSAPKIKAEKIDKVKEENSSKVKATVTTTKSSTLDGFVTKKVKKTTVGSSDESEVCLSGGDSESEVEISEKRSLPARKKVVKSYSYGSGAESGGSGSESDDEETSKKSRKKKHDDTSDDEIELVNTSDEKPKTKKSKIDEKPKAVVKEKTTVLKSKENIQPKAKAASKEPEIKKQRSKTTVRKSPVKSGFDNPFTKAKAAKKANKYADTSDDDDDCDVIEDESDSDFELTKPVTKAKGKEFDLFKKVAGANGSKREAASTIATKKAKINDDSDDDLYAVD